LGLSEGECLPPAPPSPFHRFTTRFTTVSSLLASDYQGKIPNETPCSSALIKQCFSRIKNREKSLMKNTVSSPFHRGRSPEKLTLKAGERPQSIWIAGKAGRTRVAMGRPIEPPACRAECNPMGQKRRVPASNDAGARPRRQPAAGGNGRCSPTARNAPQSDERAAPPAAN